MTSERTSAAPPDRRLPLGRLGEEIAARRLAQLGWQIVARNWRHPRGEIDIIARDGEWLVFVEVRTRRVGPDGEDPYLGRPEDSVTRRKQRQLARTAEAYLFASPWHGPSRVDVIALELAEDDTVERMEHYQDAVSG